MIRGSALIDSILFVNLTLGAMRRVKISVCEPNNVRRENIKDCNDAFYFQFFMIMTRGDYSHGMSKVEGIDVPRFLLATKSFNQTPYFYMRKLASFSKEKLWTSWVKGVSMASMDPILIARLMLGLAGYRYINVFKKFTPSLSLTDTQYNCLRIITLLEQFTKGLIGFLSM